MKTRLIVITLSLLIYANLQAQSWQFVGKTEASSGTLPDLNATQKLAFSPSGVPFIAYRDEVSGKTFVKSFSGANWLEVGNITATGSFNTGATYYQSLAISPSGVPYIAFRDGNFKANVLSFNGSNWDSVGPLGVSSLTGTDCQIVISPSGVPYLMYSELGTSIRELTVKSFNGVSWNLMHSEGLRYESYDYNNIAINTSGKIYIAYHNKLWSNKTSVRSINNNLWENVGSIVAGGKNAYFQSLAISPSGVPYVAYKDNENLGKTAVISFVGTNWGNVGNAAISTGNTEYQSIAFSSSGIPYVAYCDVANGGKTTVISYNGTSWNLVGTGGFSKGIGVNQSLKIHPVTGEPWVAYRGLGNTTIVQKFARDNQQIPGMFISKNVSVSSSSLNLSLITATSGLPVTFLSSAPAIASVNGSNLIINAVGVTTITAFQPGNSSFLGVTVTGLLTVTNKTDQTISFDPLTNITLNGVNKIITLSATATSGLPVTFNLASNPIDAAVVSSNQLTISKTGSITITATQAGNASFNEATSIIRSFEVFSVSGTNTITSINMDGDDRKPFIYPNPASDIIKINPLINILSVEIMNVCGKVEKVIFPSTSFTHEIDVQDLLNGFHFVRITEKNAKQRTMQIFINR